MRYPRYIYEAVTLIEVEDGDSVHLIIDKGMREIRGKMRNGRIEPELYRLSGIDAKKGNTPEGIAAKKALTDLIFGADLRVETLKDPEKYGRYLVIIEARLADQWVNVNNAMLAGGWAVAYFGKGKADA